MNADDYLARIGAERPERIDERALARLQVAHLLAVPFENLDIWRATPITLVPEAMFDKVVRNLRGGFCYELNGLFAWLLAELGFRVTLLSGRTVGGSHGDLGPEFDHLVLRVDLDSPWLVDVGFGDSFRDPLPLRADSDFVDMLGRTYRLDRNGPHWHLRERLDATSEALDVDVELTDEEWRPQYRFSLEAHDLSEFEATCRWQQTESPFFTKHRFCTIATPDGRRTLMDQQLIVRSGRRREVREVAEHEVPEILRALFGVQL